MKRRVKLRPAQESCDTQLVAAREENACRSLNHLDGAARIGIGALVDVERAHFIHLETSEEFDVPVADLRLSFRGDRDDDDFRVTFSGAADELSENLALVKVIFRASDNDERAGGRA